jgi:hypothetical protein
VGVAGDVAALGDELAELEIVQLEGLLGGQARVEETEVDLVRDDGEGELAVEALLLVIHEGVMRDERGNLLRARLGELGPSELPAVIIIKA